MDVPVITLADVEATARRLAGLVRRTPVQPWEGETARALLGEPSRVVLKLELFQHTGTFKVRGAFNVLLGQLQEARARGITAVSAGNHAIAAAFAARRLGASAKVVMLASANPFRVARCRELGAELLLVDGIAEAFAAVERLVHEEGRLLVHPFEGLATSLGTATLGDEFLQQAPDLDAVLVPIGGGGLASGVAAAVKLRAPRCQVWGVEPEGAPTMTAALAAGQPVPVTVDTIADSLGAPYTGPCSFALCRQHLDGVVLVDDDALRRAQLLAFGEFKLALEPAGAAATAALLGPLRERLRGKAVGLIVCGSNIDLPTFHRQVRPALG